MIVLITGVSHVGKTLLARRMFDKVALIESDCEEMIEAVLDAIQPRLGSLQSA